MKSLDDIARECKTDKSSDCHNFAVFYDQCLSSRRDKSIRLLEIGVKQGASLNMWAEYFHDGEIHGADINPQKAIYTHDDIHVHYVDQNSVESIDKLFNELGAFDIIVDDGSHKVSHQLNTMTIGLKFLRKGGVYIMEDLHTSLDEYAKRYRDAEPTTLEVLRDMAKTYRVDFYECPTKGHDSTSMTAAIYV